MACLLCAAIALACPRALAQSQAQGLALQQLEGGNLASTGTAGWNATLGIGLAAVPRYPGASDDRARLIPLISVSYDNLVFLSPLGLAIRAIHADGFFAGPVIGYEGSRHQSDDPYLAGLGDIPASLTAGAFAGYAAGPWRLLITARQAVTHSMNGLEGLAELEYHAELVPHQLTLNLGPEVSFADGQYNRTWFGVSLSQSADSGLPVYTPGGGINAVGVHAGFVTALSAHILVRVFGDVRRLTGDAAASPIVQRRTEGVIGVGIAYRFRALP
ncbi:MAG TPA: MipA/OmpV family protein [Steroidobacteraceae bacterium]|nr:MipA/OmpV family protein [Steroidobacteraceae bacterium]